LKKQKPQERRLLLRSFPAEITTLDADYRRDEG
jgi:hypothetical protein